MAVSNAGLRLVMAFLVRWCSFVPGLDQIERQGERRKRLTHGLLSPTHSLVEFVPFEETPDGTFAYIDLEVSQHEEYPHEFEAALLEFWESILNVEGVVYLVGLCPKPLAGD